MSHMISVFAGFAGRFGVSTREAERFLKFAVVGAIGFMVDFGLFNLLRVPLSALLIEGTGLHNALIRLGLVSVQVVRLGPALASTISFIGAIISNFWWNRYWTYPDSRSKSVRRQVVVFTLVSVAGILIRAPIINYTHQPFAELLGDVPALAARAELVGDNLALILAVIVVMFWNFFVNRYWTYNDVS